jgi:hypothetical protein
MNGAPRREVFDAIDVLARVAAHAAPQPIVRSRPAGAAPPHLTEAWYCCAEPGPDIAKCV